MPLPDGHRAQVTFQATNWSGWDPDGYSIVTCAKLFVAKGSRLNPATLLIEICEIEIPHFVHPISQPLALAS